MEEQKSSLLSRISDILASLIFCVFALFMTCIPCVFIYFCLADSRYLRIITYGCMALLPALIIGLVLLRNKKKFLKYWALALAVLVLAAGINTAYIRHDDSITIDTTPASM